MRDTFEKFNPATVSLHWIIAIGMIDMLAFGLYIEYLPKGLEKGALMLTHKSFSIIILVLASARILWRIINKFPKPLSVLPNWQEKLAKFIHWFLIIGTVMMPISGIIMTLGGGRSLNLFGLKLIAGSEEKIEALSQAGHIMHGLGSKLIILFLILHIIGAIKHQVMDKDGTLSRMVGKRVKTTSNIS